MNVAPPSPTAAASPLGQPHFLSHRSLPWRRSASFWIWAQTFLACSSAWSRSAGRVVLASSSQANWHSHGRSPTVISMVPTAGRSSRSSSAAATMKLLLSMIASSSVTVGAGGWPPSGAGKADWLTIPTMFSVAFRPCSSAATIARAASRSPLACVMARFSRITPRSSSSSGSSVRASLLEQDAEVRPDVIRHVRARLEALPEVPGGLLDGPAGLMPGRQDLPCLLVAGEHREIRVLPVPGAQAEQPPFPIADRGVGDVLRGLSPRRTTRPSASPAAVPRRRRARFRSRRR